MKKEKHHEEFHLSFLPFAAPVEPADRREDRRRREPRDDPVAIRHRATQWSQQPRGPGNGPSLQTQNLRILVG